MYMHVDYIVYFEFRDNKKGININNGSGKRIISKETTANNGKHLSSNNSSEEYSKRQITLLKKLCNCAKISNEIIGKKS